MATRSRRGYKKTQARAETEQRWPTGETAGRGPKSRKRQRPAQGTGLTEAEHVRQGDSLAPLFPAPPAPGLGNTPPPSPDLPRYPSSKKSGQQGRERREMLTLADPLGKGTEGKGATGGVIRGGGWAQARLGLWGRARRRRTGRSQGGLGCGPSTQGEIPAFNKEGPLDRRLHPAGRRRRTDPPPPQKVGRQAAQHPGHPPPLQPTSLLIQLAQLSVFNYPGPAFRARLPPLSPPALRNPPKGLAASEFPLPAGLTPVFSFSPSFLPGGRRGHQVARG